MVGVVMLICRECGKIIGEIGNGKKMYSCCLSCGKDYEKGKESNE